MADTKISALPAASSLTGTEIVPIDQAGNTVQTTSAAIAALAAGGSVTLNGVQTLTNKRITLRVVQTSANSATPAINTDNCDVFQILAQSVAITSFTTGLTGTPQNTDPLIIQITGTTSIALAWGTSFEAGDCPLPTTTVGTAMLTIGFTWNPATSAWRCQSGVAPTTLSGVRIYPRVVSTNTNSATPAISTDVTDVFKILAQTAAITSFTTGLTGTPSDSDSLEIQITGTASVALTWGASFESSTVTLPTTTSGTNRLDVGFLWNTATNKWRCMAVA